MAEQIKTELEMKIGIPVSIGIGASKTQAKYAVEVAKKTNGVSVIDERAWREVATRLALGDLWGVGRQLSLRYEAAGYKTVADVLTATPARIKALFGVTGQRLVAELCGQPAYPVVSQLQVDQKSMMSSRSFREATTDCATLEDAVAYHTRHIAESLRQKQLLAKTVRISIQASKYSDFLLQGASLEAVLDRPTQSTFSLLAVTQKLLQQAYKTGVPYQKVGVSVAQLVSAQTEQLMLFTSSETKHKRILEIMDSLNTKADCELVRIGDRNRSLKWQSRQDRRSPAYTTKWTDVPLVKA
jgi:DNA polymerase V